MWKCSSGVWNKWNCRKNSRHVAFLTRLEELAGEYYAMEIPLPCIVQGIQKFSALCILSEIGNDMGTPSAKPPTRRVGPGYVRATVNRQGKYSRAKQCTVTNTCGRFLLKYPG
jgi:hypothetical protein